VLWWRAVGSTHTAYAVLRTAADIEPKIEAFARER
jgi:hypothetical protein